MNDFTSKLEQGFFARIGVVPEIQPLTGTDCMLHSKYCSMENILEDEPFYCSVEEELEMEGRFLKAFLEKH